MGQYKVDTLYMFIENQLIHFGFSPQYVGFHYLSHAIHWAILDKRVPFRLSTNLYPRIAEPLGITGSAVEHGIRNLIATAWQRNEAPALRNLFGATSVPPTNAYCIGLMARAIRTQYFLARQKSHMDSQTPSSAS